jgi:hypothetical protein
VSIKKVLQNKATAKTSNNSDFNSDKITNIPDINKLKIDVKAFIKVCGIITCLQTKSTTIDTVANKKSLSNKGTCHNLDKLKTLKFVIKSSKKEKDSTSKRKSKRQTRI